MIDEFWQRVKEGRIEVVCGYSNPRLSEVYPELFVRSLVLGKEYFRRHVPGIRQDVLEVPDLMCGTSQVPQILALADYRYFMFTRPVSQQAVFWRKGLDGTRMLVVQGRLRLSRVARQARRGVPGHQRLARLAVCHRLRRHAAHAGDGRSSDWPAIPTSGFCRRCFASSRSAKNTPARSRS